MPNSCTRLLLALEGKPVDRPPVICPGGMMTMATRSAMLASGCNWPAAHSDAPAMARLVLATQQETGLECLSVPFCMTVEAEALGCKIDMGSETVLPHVKEEAISSVSDWGKLPPFDPETSGRAPVVLEAIRILNDPDKLDTERGMGILPMASHGREARATTNRHPIVGAVVGPVSLAATVMRAEIFLRLAQREPEAAEKIIKDMEAVSLKFALAQHAAGADCIMIAEPTGTGEILGAKHFRRFALPALIWLLSALKERGIPAILHICGDVKPILAELSELHKSVGSLALSVDAMVSGRTLKENLPECVRIGNIDTYLLEISDETTIENVARRAAREFDIVSPACGLSPTTPAGNLRAMTQAVRG